MTTLRLFQTDGSLRTKARSRSSGDDFAVSVGDKTKQARLLASRVASCLILLAVLAMWAVHPEPAVSAPSSSPSIDGTYELTERVMADGTVLRPPSVVALYTLAQGRFNLNLFVKNRDGTIASESTIGRYTFSEDKYCEWIDYTIRNNLDKPGVTNEAPAVTNHCTPVTSKNGRFNFSPPGEGVEVSFGAEDFTARIGTEFVDHWRKIR
jgi:hypothetical protein